MFSVYLLPAVVDKDPLGTDHLSDPSSPAYRDYSIPWGSGWGGGILLGQCGSDCRPRIWGHDDECSMTVGIVVVILAIWHMLIYGWFGIKLNQMGPPHMLHLTWFPWVDVICKSEIGGLGCTCRLGCSQIAVALLGAQLRLNYRPAGHHRCLYPTGLVSAKRVYQRDRDTWRQMVIGEYANVESSTKCLMPHQLNLLCQKVVGQCWKQSQSLGVANNLQVKGGD